MSDLEKYHSQQLVQDTRYLKGPGAVENDSSPGLIVPVLRHWRIMLLAFLSVCTVGIPVVWLSVKPGSQATAAIRVAPIIPSILFSDKDSERVIPMYENFKNTQADLLMDDKVLRRVVDALMDKNLVFFNGRNSPEPAQNSGLNGQAAPDAVALLRQLLVRGDIKVIPERHSELLKISMEIDRPGEAVQIVNSFVDAYMAVVVSEEAKDGDLKLTVLENERRVLADRLERHRKAVHDMSQEYGTSALQDRQKIMLDRVAAMQAELTRVETRKVILETQIELFRRKEDRNISGEQLLKVYYDFVNADLMVKALTENIAQLEQSLIVAKQTLAPANPEIHRKTELLETLKQRLEQRRKEVGRSFDEMLTEESAKSDKNKLKSINAELEQTIVYEKRLQEMLDKEDSRTIELGRKQLAIQDLQEQLNMTKELYETVQRRLQELEMERKRPARVSVAYYANTIPVRSKRAKYTAALMFGAVISGMFLALLRDRVDRSIHTPDDVVKHVGIRVIGTTTRLDGAMKSLSSRRIIDDDYQTICANLGLFNGEGTPKKLVITSPGPREGKTTLSINLAASLAKIGKNVLLIDGDMRKSDIAKLLKLPYANNGVREVLLGREFEKVVYVMPAARFHVLTSNPCEPSKIYELIARQQAGEFMDVIGLKYDHIIIDSPPVLAVPDALLWAKLSDAVILTSLADQTRSPDIRETLYRLAQIKVKVLGIVLNNVPYHYGYNPYGYGYHTSAGSAGVNHNRTTRKVVLLPIREKNNNLDTRNS
jgi:capsular exopolysaccharide synthesis family protein